MGGVSGQVGFPKYMEDTHSMLLFGWCDDDNIEAAFDVNPSTFDLVEMYVQSANSPYNGEAAVSPDSYVAAMRASVNALKAFVDARVPTSDWSNFAYTAIARANSMHGSVRLREEYETFHDAAKGESQEVFDNSTDVSLTKTRQLVSQAKEDLLPIVSELLEANTDNEQLIEDQTKNFEDVQRGVLMRSINRVSGVFFMSNAVHTSTYAQALMALERDFGRQIADFQGRLRMELLDRALNSFAALLTAYLQTGVEMTREQIASYLESYKGYITGWMQDESNKNQYILQSTNDMLKLLNDLGSSKQGLASLTVETERIAFVAKTEQAARDIELDVLDAYWPFDVILKGGNVLQLLNGAPIVPQRPSQTQSAIGGALSGAGVGAKIGSMIPGAGPIGTAIGALGGAIIGYGASYL